MTFLVESKGADGAHPVDFCEPEVIVYFKQQKEEFT